MDIGGALAFVAKDPSVAEYPLARFASALINTGARSVREAASIQIKATQAELDAAEIKLDQFNIARDKLKAELQRVEAMALEAQAAKLRSTEMLKMCKLIIASGFVDGTPSSAGAGVALPFDAYSRSNAPAPLDLQAPEMGHGASRDAPANPTPGTAVPAVPVAPRGGAPASVGDARSQSSTLTPQGSLILALTSEVEVKESALLQIIATADAAAQKESRPRWQGAIDDWLHVADLLWNHLPVARAPIQIAECNLLKALLQREPLNDSDPMPEIVEASIGQGAAASLTKLVASINDDVKAESLEIMTVMAGFAQVREHFVHEPGLASAVLKVVETSNSEPVLERALTALWTLAGSDAGKSVLHELGAIPAVLGLMFTDSIAILDNVVMALGLLTRDSRCKASMREHGGLEKLVACLLHPSVVIRVKAAGSLWNCAADADNRAALLKLGAVPLLVEQLTTPETQENAGGALWNLALEHDGKTALLEFGGIPAMVSLLTSSDTAVVENATGTLWNCSSTLENRAAMRKFGALPPIVGLLRSTTETIRENAAGALRNLVINDQNKVAAREAGAIDLIVDIIEGAKDVFLEKLVATLWVLSVPTENKHAIRLAKGFPKITALLARKGLASVNKEKLVGTIRNCSAEAENRGPLLELGVVRLVAQAAVDLGALERPPRASTLFREHVAALYWNLAKDDKVGPGRDGALEVLVALLDDPHDAVVEQAAAGISNLVSNTPENRDRLEAMRAVERLGLLLEHAATNQRPVVLQHALHAVKHSTAQHEGNQRQLLGLRNIVPRLLNIVAAPPVPTNLEGAVRCAEDILREGVFCLRNIASLPAGAELMRSCDAVNVLQRLAETARTDTIKIATTVVLQALTKRPVPSSQ